MSDLVETVISQVMRMDTKPRQQVSFQKVSTHRIHRFSPSSAQADGNGIKRDPKLWNVSVQFEAIFTQKMLESMHKSVPKSGFLPHGFAEQVHHSMFDQAVAKAMSQTGSMGIARSIYQQISRAQGTQVTSPVGDQIHKPLRGGREGV